MSIILKTILFGVILLQPFLAIAQEPVTAPKPTDPKSLQKPTLKPRVKLNQTPDPSAIGGESVLGAPQPAAPTRNENPAPSSTTKPAQPTDMQTPVEQPVSEVEKKEETKWYDSKRDDRENRALNNWGVTGNYSLMEMWVLTKWGLSASYTNNPAWTYELEYANGSLGWGYFGIDIGRIKEERVSVLARSFSKRNSFNFLYGVFYNKLDFRLGKELLDAANAANSNEFDSAEVTLAGLTWGFGNRWHTRKGYIVGIDWLTINLPFSVIQQHAPFLKRSQDENDRKDFKDSLDFIKRFPSIGVLKFQVGLTF